MGLLSSRVERSAIMAGDHIYTWRALFTYSHHGIYVGGQKVVHFTRKKKKTSSSTDSPSSSSSFKPELPPACPIFPDCGFQQPNSGVILSCLDCFLDEGSLHNFEYGVAPSVFLTKVRGGTCTTASSDPPGTVIHRAMYLLQNGFGNYDLFENNCEDFALYCKTGLLPIDEQGIGRSGQASSVIGIPLAAIFSSPFKLLVAGMYCAGRYITDIGVRKDVIKVSVEDLAVNLGWRQCSEEGAREDDSSNDALFSSKSEEVRTDHQKA
ncbi:hypothetical protein KSP40_PGU014505 [Platanthera guangdongensis]|uniref:LRAT domain-containing protein n=1 Tax=Platanthera guangdongensis TaxID=2320717 RepID=A0ABR2M140_9ASPA